MRFRMAGRGEDGDVDRIVECEDEQEARALAAIEGIDGVTFERLPDLPPNPKRPEKALESDPIPESQNAEVVDHPPPLAPADRAAMLAVAHATYAENYSRKVARKRLLEAGCPVADVNAVVEEAWQAYVGGQRAQGFVELVVGALMLVAGIWITSATYREAEASGGSYAVMTGLIVFGAYGFFRGTVRLIGGR